MRTERELWDAILASSRMPLGGRAAGRDRRAALPRRRHGARRSRSPRRVAAGATHVLALQTRPHGVPRRSASRLADRMIERHLRGLNPDARDGSTASGSPPTSASWRTSRGARLDPSGGPPHVLGHPPAGGHAVRRPARARARRAAARGAGRRAARRGGAQRRAGAAAPRPRRELVARRALARCPR